MSAVRLDEPRWWYEPVGEGLRDRVLASTARLVGALAERRFRWHQPYKARIPVICIGNFTVGGTGKTPLCQFVIELLRTRGETPVCLTRGYGGTKRGPVWVDRRVDSAKTVGDEPMLLSERLAVLLARDRAAGARAIESGSVPASVIVMDDGLQNPSLKKDFSIAVIDGERGVGNGQVLPSGPLRAPLEFQLGLVDCIVVNGNTEPDEDAHETVLERFRRSFQGPVLAVRTEAKGDTAWLRGKPVLAFAGIGNPRRFFDLLASLGADVKDQLQFPDHHVFTAAEADALIRQARELGAGLVTTEKDLARLTGMSGSRGELSRVARALPVHLVMEERERVRLLGLIDAVIGVKPSANPLSEG
jgi:tetraacyldisaccharide 4'-kinase